MNLLKKIALLSLIGFNSLSFAVPPTDTTWTGTIGGDQSMNNVNNWSNGIPDATKNAIFSSTLSNISLTPQISTPGTIFIAESFQFTATASDFTITIGGPSSLLFTGTGIIGTHVNPTITATNNDTMTQVNLTTSISQIQFYNTNSIVNSIGNATITLSNSGTLSNLVGTPINDIAQLLFDGSGSFIGTTGTSIVNMTGTSPFVSASNTGIIENIFVANDLAQILFDGSGGLSDSSGGHGYSSVSINGPLGGTATLAATNSGTISNAFHANDIAQILFDGSRGLSYGAGGFGQSLVTIGGGTFDGTAILTATNSGSILNTSSSNANDLAQILFDGSGGYSSFNSLLGTGTSNVTILGNSQLEAVNGTGGVLANLNNGNDVAQILFDGSGGLSDSSGGSGHSVVSIGGGALGATATLIATNSGTISNTNNRNDLAQILFDGSSGENITSSGTASGFSNVTLNNNVFIAAENSGLLATSGGSNGVAQILFDGRGVRGGSGTSVVQCTGSNNILTATNSGTINGDQIAFYNSLVTGTLSINATNSGSGTVNHGVAFYGTLTGANDVNVVVTDTSLWIDSTLPSTFAIGSMNGNAGSSAVINQSLNLTGNGSATFSGIISGAGTLSITGGQALNLFGTNTYTGGTNLMAGSIFVGNNLGLSNGTLTMNDGTELDLGNGITVANAINLLANENIGVASSIGTLSGIISGAGTLNKVGAGQLVLTGTNSYTGGTNLTAGSILVGNNTALGSGVLAMSANTELDLANGINMGNSISLSGSDTIAVASGLATLSGPISGPGSLVKEGAGTLDLAGVESYSGGTIINSGTLSLSGAGALLPSGPVTINNSGVFDISNSSGNQTIGELSSSSATTLVALGSRTLTVGTSSGSTYAGGFNGSGSIVKEGSGRWNLTGNTPFAGLITANNGIISLNGDYSQATFLMNQNTTLQGNGTFGTANIYGTISPGNSIGHLYGSHLHLFPGSTYLLEISPDGQTDLVTISGDTVIDPGVTLEVLPTPGSYQNGQVFTFIESGSIVESNFNVVLPSFRINAQVVYFPTHIDLVLGINSFVSILPACSKPNVVAMAEYIDYIDGLGPVVPGSDFEVVFNTLSHATPEQLAAGLDTLQPAAYSTMILAQEQTVLNLRSGVSNRLDEMREMTYEACSIQEWVAPLGTYSRQLSRYGESGYQSNMYGILGGIDTRLTDWLCGGVDLGYTNTYVDWTAPKGHGHITSAYLGLYGQGSTPWFFVDGGVTVAADHFNSHRTIFLDSSIGSIDRKAKSKHNGIQVDSYLGIGTNWCDCWNCGVETTILASLDWVYTHEDSFCEYGADSLDLVVKGKNCNLWRPALGVTLSKQICNWVPEIGVAIQYYGRSGGGSTRFRLTQQEGWADVHGLYPSEWRAAPQASLTGLFWNDTMSIQAAYNGEYSKDYIENNVSLNFGLQF